MEKKYEASGSYLYFHNAPSVTDFEDETFRLLGDLHRYDVLRCDKSTAGAGLEVRVPFLDKSFLHTYMSISGKHKMTTPDRMEKYLLRKSFDGFEVMPDEVLWRQKEAMSDGVSSQKRSWHHIIQEYVESKYSKDELERFYNLEHNPVKLDESAFYRDIFQSYYPGRDRLIPYYWLPRWSGDLVDPSARNLKHYGTEDNK